MENPRKTNQKKFDEEMTELRAVITPEQDLAIRQQFNEAKKTPPVTFKAKKTTTPEEAKALKKKEIKSVEVGQAPSKKKAPEPVSKVTIPTKSEVKPTPAMKVAAQQMKITPEEAISKSNTPSGMKQLKEKVTKETFEKIAKQKNKSILYEGNAEREFTGSELYPLVNKNYDMFSVTLGDEAAADLLVTTKQIANKSVTVDTLKSLGMKAGTIKTLLLFGIL